MILESSVKNGTPTDKLGFIDAGVALSVFRDPGYFRLRIHGYELLFFFVKQFGTCEKMGLYHLVN